MVGTGGLDRLYDPEWSNFSPRVGFAWDVTGKSKTVVRGGLGYFLRRVFAGLLCRAAAF